MRSEAELVTLLCRKPLAHESRDRLHALLRSRPNWELVFALTRKWEVGPVVFSNLQSLNEISVLVPIRDEVAELARSARAHALGGSLKVVGLVREFAKAGIDVLVLKGPALGIMAYDDPSLRGFADADLLVKKSDLHLAVDTLLALGFRPDYDRTNEDELISRQHALEFSREGNKVELHWALLSKHLRCDIDVDELWREARSVECAGQEIRVIAPEHLFLFICAHGAKHEWERLRWICDVAQLSERLTNDEVSAVIGLAAHIHARRLLLLGLVLARDILAADITRFQPSNIGDERQVRGLAQMTLARLGFLESGSTRRNSLVQLDQRLGVLAYWIGARERARDRIACMATVLFSPTFTDGKAGALRWLKRPLRLAGLALRRVGA